MISIYIKLIVGMGLSPDQSEGSRSMRARALSRSAGPSRSSGSASAFRRSASSSASSWKRMI